MSRGTGGFLRQCALMRIRSLATSSRDCSNEVRVRFAPSPTGYLHLGGLRTALYNYLFAKAQRGRFILRIEDTDQGRLVPGAENHLHKMLQWSGIHEDEGPFQGGNVGPYRQSERLHLYDANIKKLIETGAAYHCFCTEQRLELLRKEALRSRQVPRYDNRCRHLPRQQVQDQLQSGRPSVVRLKLAQAAEPFDDLVYGRTRHDTALIEGDPVLIKSDGFPTYHFANVVDDHLMGITHVLRGMEWITSTPKHLLLYKALCWNPPQFAHLPLLLNRDGSKLSKRQGDIFVQHFKDSGYLPEAVVNFITFCGSGFEENKEIRDMQQLIEQFSLSRVSTHSAVLDMDLLPDVNRGHIKRLLTTTEGRHRLLTHLRHDVAQLLSRSPEVGESMNQTDEYLLRILEARQHHIGRILDLCQPDYLYLWQRPRASRSHFSAISEDADVILNGACREIEGLREGVVSNAQELSPALKRRCEELEGVPYAVFMRVIRLALSNLKKGASVAEMMAVLGKDEVMHRLHTARQIVNDTAGCVER